MKNRIVKYKVAEHIFEIEAGEDILALLSNYAPFAYEGEGEPVFSLKVSPLPASPLGEVAAPQGMTLVYTDTSDDDMPRIEVYRGEFRGRPEAYSVEDAALQTGWIFRISTSKTGPVVSEICCTADFREALVSVADPVQTRFAIDNAAMLLFAFSTAGKGTLEMHASVTVKDGKGYLFLGHSGTGKSTHSRQWLETYEDAWLLNDDNPIVITPSGSPCLGGEMAMVYGSPWSGKTPCYKNASVPIGGIVKLSQAPVNEMKPLRLPEAYAYVLSSSSGLKILPEMMDALYETISQLIQSVGCWHLDCLPNHDAAHVCHDAMVG